MYRVTIEAETSEQAEEFRKQILSITTKHLDPNSVLYSKYISVEEMKVPKRKLGEKDFDKAASIITRFGDDVTKDLAYTHFSAWFQDENNRFDRYKFRDACGLK